MVTQQVNIEGIGVVVLTRRRNSNRISMRLKPDGAISVNYPWHVTADEAFKFVKDNADWVLKHRTENQQRRRVYKIGEIITTRNHTIQIATSPKPSGYANIANGKAVICIPESKPVEHISVQKFIRDVIAEVYRREAKVYLPSRVEQLARSHGFKYNQVYVKKLKSKWGSCSSKGNINLNVYLMDLPDHLIDFIILHELVHTREPNHGEKFKSLLDEVSGGKSRQFERELKQYSRENPH